MRLLVFHVFLSCLCTALAPPAAAALVEEFIEIPATVTTIHNQPVTQNILVTIWRDDTRIKAPFLVLNHGRPARREAYAKMGRQRYPANSAYFVSKGFVVMVPTRVGYGPSGGVDVEYAGPCATRLYEPVFHAAAQQTLAVLEHAKSLGYVDTSRGLVVGQSFGGATAIALAALSPAGVIAAVNFAGGSGGNPESSPERPCRPELLEKTFADYGKSAKIPTLWLYSENDRFFGNVFPKRWFEAYVASGGQARFVTMPPYRDDGHASFTLNPEAWKPAFDAFLKAVGLP